MKVLLLIDDHVFAGMEEKIFDLFSVIVQANYDISDGLVAEAHSLLQLTIERYADKGND